MDKCVVVAVDSGSYAKRSGEQVNYCKIYYFNVSDKENSRLEKGFRILVKDVAPFHFSLEDFSQVPGCYKLHFRPGRNRLGKPEPILKEIEFISEFKIPENQDHLLLLSAKRYEFEDEKGKSNRGVKFFAVDPLGYDSSNGFCGYPIIEGNLKASLDVFEGLPSYYEVIFEQVRGKNGDALYKPVTAKFQAPFIPNSVPVS